MPQAVPQGYRSIIRIFSACLLTWLLIAMPLVPFAPTSRGESRSPNRESARPQSPETSKAAAAANNFVNAPVPQPAPAPMYAPSITATKDDGIAAATPVAPGGTITYTVNINNNGINSPADDALNVVFSDTIDAHTTLVPNSAIGAASDKYTTIGNVQITIPDGTTDLLGNDFDPDTGNNAGMTVTAETKSSTACTGGCSDNVTINADGSFTYDPPIGFTGNDTFTYTANSGTSSISTTVTITVANKLWFINNNAGACTSNCDGRLSHPFTSLAAFNLANGGGPGQPGDNDWIFVFESTTPYTGPATLRNGQKFIGQDATASLISLTGFAQPSGTDPIPVMNSANGTIVQITTAAAATNGINLLSGNTLRGFTVGNTTGAKISGNNFGTLLVGNSASPDVTLNGTGQALNLTTGTLSVAGRFVSVTTTSSTGAGINLASVADSDGPGNLSFSFSSTSVSGSTNQGILVGTSTADLNFGNTSVTGGTDAISLQNNSNGTRTFGTIATSGNTGAGFLHAAGGGAVNVTGATTITNPGGNGIDIDASNANVAFAATTVSKNAAGTAVDLTNNATRIISFTSLAITNSVGIGLNANNSGTVNVAGGSIATTGAGAAATLTGTTLGLVFTSVSSNNGVNGLTFSGGSGTFASGTTNLQNNGGIGIQMSSSAVAANFGNTTVNSSAGDAVDLSTNTGAITFADLDLTPDANFRGLDALDNSGTITSTSGDIAATGNAAIFIDGPVGRTPLAMVLNNVDSTNSSGNGVSLTDVSGSFTVNDATLATNVSGSAGIGVLLSNSTATASFGNTTVGTTTGIGISLNASIPSTGAVTFGTTNVTNTTGTGISVVGSGATTFGATTVTGTGNANADDNGTGIILTNNTGAMTFGALTITPDSGERGLFATDNTAASAAGVITIPSGTITTINDTAVEITGASAAARTPLNIQLTTVNTTGGAVAANGIYLQNTSANGSPGGFRVLGTGGTCTNATPTCSGGRITNTTGADGATGGTGVRLDTVADVVLTRMRLDAHTNFAVRGFSVTGFVMDTCVVDGTNGNNAGASEGSVIFDGLFGTAAGSNSNLITASDIRGGWTDNVRVLNNTATAGELTIQNSTIRSTNTGTNGNDNVHIISNLSANLKVVITGSTFAATNGDHIQTIADGTSQFTIIVTGNTFSGGGGVNALGQGITISGGSITGGVTDSTEVVRFDISNNIMNGTIQGGAININEGVGNGNWQGRVSGNTIGTAATPGSGASQSAGIRVENHSKGTLTASVLNNTVHQWSTQGINLQAGDNTATGLGNGPLNVTVTGNTVANPNHNPPSSFPDHGIQLNVGTQTNNANLACAFFQNNNSTGNLAGGGVDYRLRQRMITTVTLPGFGGPAKDATNTPPAVRTYILTRPNTAGHGNPNDVAASVSTLAASGGYAVNALAQCTQPTVPTAPAVVTQIFQAPRDQKNDVIAAIPNQAGPDVASAPATQSAPATGPSFLQRTITAVASFAGAFSSMIMPTAHAAEITPTEAAKAAAENVQSRTKVTSHHAASARRPVKAENRVMNHASAPAMAAPWAGETVTANIGTLPAGGSVTIKFQVTVNNPPNLTLLGPPRIENQGQVTGTNFPDTLTDDPEAGGVQKTVTLIDLFDTTTTLASDLNPSDFGEQVTFTATINETPAQGTVDPAGTVDFIDTSNLDAVICDNVPVTGSSAQCQTSSLTAGTHNIRADYSGDGNFDPSQSNVVEQVVNACAQDPVVTTADDSGPGSLREALDDVCTGDTITFDIAGAGPHTIALTTGELVVASDVIINNNSGESITVSGGTSRAFNINPSTTATIIGLTISGSHSTTSGGGILNDGTLTIINSTLTANSADIDGGAISNSGPGNLTLINTTISGNNATGNGGGVVNLGGTVTSINSTFTNNRADSDDNDIGTGGGIHHGSGTTTLHNTIVAGNFNEEGTTDTADDISGTVNATSSFNLIGTGGSGGLTNGVNDNQVNVADAGLGVLANNGGTTQTHALFPTSSAVERGSNANLPADTFDFDGDANLAETLSVDQRGAGFPRSADSSDVDTIQTVDIGAFELHPSIENIANQTTNEDTVKNVLFNLGDDTGSLIATVEATSSNTTLVPNANLVLSGSGGSRNLQITPAAEQSGTTTITVTVTATNGRTASDAFELTVNTVNDAPVANDDSYSTDEDTPLTVNAASGVLANDTDGDTPLTSLTAIQVTGPSNALSFTLNADGSFTYTPAANFNGQDTFTYKANDGTSDSNVATVTITVNAINDAPTVAINAGITVEEGSTNNIITNTMLRVDDVDNTAAQIVFTIGTAPVNGTLKKLGVALAAGGTFTQDDINNNRITYDHNGSNTTSDSFTFTVSDGAGGTIGLTTFNITIGEVNDAPTITAGGTLNYTENDPATAIDTTITVTDPDSPNLASATVVITGNYANGQDVLSFVNTATITGTFTAGTGTLELSGSDTVANYQTALRAVRYNNTSENPSTLTRTVSWTVNDGALPSNTATSTINVTAVNDAPVNTVPLGTQSTNQNTPLTFSSGTGNQISVADVDAGTADIQVTLTATNGTVTLASTAGLTSHSGNGTNNVSMQGPISAINPAMNGMTFTPTSGFSGAASLTIVSNDLGNTGTGGPKTDTDVVNIQVATNLSIQDAQVAEPSSGSANMVFTVTLSAPAPASGASVDFATEDQPGSCITCAAAGQDYTATSGTLNFLPGEQFKTISVPVLSDNKKNEANETFLVVLTNPVNAQLADDTAIGTILIVNQAGVILISEIRTSGPGGAGDDFVEIYNNTDSPHVVSPGGYGLFKMGATCNDTPVLIGIIPGSTTIPARGHFLFTGSAYSLANYGGTGAAAGDLTLTSDIENDRNVAIFSTTSVGSLSSANRLDAVGFGTNTTGVCDLLREGTTLIPTSGSVLEHSYFRDECGKKGNPATFGPCPTAGLTKDSNINGDDFIFIDTEATSTAMGQRLGAPGPQNLGSPRTNFNVLAFLLDSTKGAAASPNRVRDTSAIGPNAAQGTMTIRRRFVNNTGAPVTRLRFRVVDISTTFAPGGVADLRLLTSSDVTVTVNDPATCTAMLLGSAPCNVTVRGTEIEEPPFQPLGGGFNSSTVTLGTPLPHGASISVQFVLGVQSTGSFKFFFNIEALP